MEECALCDFGSVGLLFPAFPRTQYCGQLGIVPKTESQQTLKTKIFHFFQMAMLKYAKLQQQK